MPESFEERYGIRESENNANAEKSESFVFPKQSSKTKEAIDKAGNKINDSVKMFANNLDGISPGLTRKLLDIFDHFKKEPQFKGLSESDLWLHSLGELYKTREIPSPLESILTEMMQLLNEYKKLRHKSQTLYEMLRACAYAETTSDSTTDETLGITPSIFKPTTSNNWGRDA